MQAHAGVGVPEASSEAPAPSRRLWKSRPVRVLSFIAYVVVIQELLARAVFPVPEIYNFDRTRYSPQISSLGSNDRNSLAHASFRWVSEPDAASSTHELNLYGFRDRTWTVRPPRSGLRVAFAGDSYVEGFLARDDETIPSVFGSEARAQGLQVETMNLGVGAAGLTEISRVLRDAVPIFRPSDVIVVLYENDFYDTSYDPESMQSQLIQVFSSPWTPRMLEVSRSLLQYGYVPTRWHRAPFDFLPPLGDERHPWTSPATAARYEASVTPHIAAAIRKGTFNPHAVELLKQLDEWLPRSPDVERHLRALRDLLRANSARPWIVYLPSLVQVSDAYVKPQLELSQGGPDRSYTGERDQAQARAVGATCKKLGLPFLDLTPALRKREAEGTRMYWEYDAHLRPAGYAAGASEIFAWWSRERGG